jgi:hypothetical protein
VYCSGEMVVFAHFYTDTLRPLGWFDANDDPVHGLWHHVGVGCIVILSVFKCRQ